MYGCVIKTYKLNDLDYYIGYTWDIRLCIPILMHFKIKYKGLDVTTRVRKKEREIIQNKIYKVLLKNKAQIEFECADAFGATAH